MCHTRSQRFFFLFASYVYKRQTHSAYSTFQRTWSQPFVTQTQALETNDPKYILNTLRL